MWEAEMLPQQRSPWDTLDLRFIQNADKPSTTRGRMAEGEVAMSQAGIKSSS